MIRITLIKGAPVCDFCPSRWTMRWTDPTTQADIWTCLRHTRQGWQALKAYRKLKSSLEGRYKQGAR